MFHSKFRNHEDFWHFDIDRFAFSSAKEKNTPDTALIVTCH